MRLFLVAVGLVALAGCQQLTAGTGAVRVELFYATFHPGCLSVTATDEADASHTETLPLTVEEGRSGSKTVAVFRKPEWSRRLRVTASAREGSCTGPEVATSTRQIEVPERGSTVVYLDLRAEDLDGDGFVAASNGGSDCDDTDAAVHPGALETCDGKDTNCSGNEEDASDKKVYYVDADGDGYGNALIATTQACAPPKGMTAKAGDCLDTDAQVHPGQVESRCDGEDDNCDGTSDEGFHVNEACVTEQQCSGAWECTGDHKGARCRSADVPKTWYADRDGDGLFGTALPLATCTAPPNTTSEQDDCDDTSRFRGGPSERCDRLDNNCDGTVDESAVCAATTWTARTVGGSTAWVAVATYLRGRAWLVGAEGKLVHVNGTTETDRSTVCSDTREWTAAWARPSDGRVFLGSARGQLATVRPSGSECGEGTPDSMVAGNVTGMVGFENKGVTTVYAVTSSGHILRWVWQDVPATPAAPHVVARVAANLRSVHGYTQDTLLAVGAEDYQPGGTPLPRVFRITPASGAWTLETIPAGTGVLRAVHVVDEALAYAVGDKGLVYERQAGTWRKLPAPDGAAAPDLLDVIAFHPSVVLALSNKSVPSPAIHFFDGTVWSEPYHPSQPLLSLDAQGAEEQWAVGAGGAVVRWGAP